jgi:subtilisin-like proprotein convertase family protein
MQKTTTLTRLKLFFGRMLPLFILLAVSVGKIAAQPYNNGNLSTGTTSSGGSTSPAGFTWSEIQPGILNYGYGANIGANLTLADNFLVPSGQGWNISKLTFYAYSTNYAGTTSPFNDIRIRIFNTDPSVGSPTPIFGDLTTNRFTASSTASMYRIAPGADNTARQIWKIEANVAPSTLGPGNYWIEWQVGTIAAGASNFTPGKTVVGTVTQPGNNAKTHDLTAGTWSTVGAAEGGNEQDIPFIVDYTIVAAPACTPITSAVISAPNNLISEGFDGTIPPAGWAVQNNSNPLGATGWTQGGPLGVFGPNTGAGFISANFNNTGTNGTISNWLMTPAITLKNGDIFSFWTRVPTGGAAFPDRLQVRMSTNGSSTNVGASETSTGDFSTLLLDINPTYGAAYPENWTKFTVTVSGVPAAGVSGRMAFRYFVEDAGLFGANSNFIGIDDVVYSSSGTPTVCSGSTANIQVNITGGVGPYTVVYKATPPGTNVTVNNYTSGTNIPVTPTANTVYTLVSVTGFDACVSANNSGSAAINVTSGSTAAVLSQVLLPPVPSVVINEGMDGTVPPAGWFAQNNSVPVGATGWTQGGPLGVFAPHSGAGFISANFNNVGTLGTISNWLVLPNTPPTLKNGDVLKFWTRTTTGQFPDRMQVRMNSTNAGTNVGTGATGVGDFTTLLLDINPTYTTTGYPTAWTEFTLTLSGLPAGGTPGRLAFRYFVENAGLLGANSDFIGIDDISYTTTIPGGPPTTCTGSTANLKVDITGGTSPYTVVINATPAAAGFPKTITNYISGTSIPVTPAVTTTYNLVSVTSSIGCLGTGNSGTPTITVSPTTIPALTIVEDPTGPLCAGNPKLLTVQAGSSLTTFTNSAPITINTVGTATPYPSNLVVSGLPTSGVTVKSVTLTNVSHTFPVDIDIILQNPAGTQNVILMSDVGGTGAITNRTYVLDDAAAAPLATGANPAGTYKPTNLVGSLGVEPDNWPAPGPGTVAQPSPTLATFTGDMNGTWKLYVVDDFSGDGGSIAGGYSISFNTPSAPPVGYTFVWSPAAGLSSTTSNPVAASPMQTTTYQVFGTAPSGCQTTAQITINVNQLPAVTTPPSNATVCEGGTTTFTAATSGAGTTFQWQVSTDGGATWTNLTNTPPYSGVNGSTLTVGPVTNAMNNYRYRIVVSGTCPPSATSASGTLTVNPLPVITIVPGPVTCGGVAGSNGTLLTASSPTGTGFTWSPATGLYTNSGATTPYVAGTPTATVYAAPTVNTVYTVTATNGTTGCVGTGTVTVNYTPNAPTVSPASATICLGQVQPLTITSSLAPVTVSGTGPGAVISDGTGDAALSNISIAGIPANGIISNISVTLNITHTWVGDLDINLKAPNGGILNLVGGLDGGTGSNGTDNFTGTVISSTSSTPISGAPAPRTGTFGAEMRVGYGPTGYEQLGPANWSNLTSTPNGTWTLAIGDFAAIDNGSLVSWNLAITYGLPAGGIWSPATGLYTNAVGTTPYVAGTPAVTVYASPTVSTTYTVTVANGTCTSPTRSVPITVNTPLAIVTQPVNRAVCTNGTTSFTFVVTGTAATHNWQVSTANGTPGSWVNITNGGVYSGANTATLTITNPPVSMNTYTYRDSVSTAPCPGVISAYVNLTVNPLPTVTIAAVPSTRLMPGMSTTLTSNSSPVAATYQWVRDGVPVVGGTGSSLTVDIDGLGTYYLNVTDVNGCSNRSNSILISDSSSGKVFIYPNPSNGRFQVRYYSILNSTGLARGVNIYDDKGARIITQKYTINAPYARMDVDMRKYGAGTYWVEVVDLNGNRLAMGRVLILR